MNERGAVLLLSVIIMGAIAVSVVSALIVGGIDNTQLSAQQQAATEAQTQAELCVEEALLQVKNSNTVSGTTVITTGGNSCSFTIINGGGSNRTINSEAQVGDVIKRLQITLDRLNPQLNVTKWENVTSF